MSTNSCISRLIIPESDQIQILVSRQQGQGRSTNGTDITVTAINRRTLRQSVSLNSAGGRGLIPVALADITKSRGRSPSRIPYLARSTESFSSGVSSCGPTPTTTPLESDRNEFPIMLVNCGFPEDLEKVEEFLKCNTEFLTTFVEKNVDNEVLDSWFLKRYNSSEDKTAFFNRWNLGVQEYSKRAIPQGLSVSLGSDSNSEGSVRWELARYISSIVYADFFVLYLSDNESRLLWKFSPQSIKSESEFYSIGDALLVATSVAKRQVCLRISRTEANRRFPQGLGDSSDNYPDASRLSEHVLCLPIVRVDRTIAGVIELHRKNLAAPFTQEDEEIAQSYLVWGGIAFHYADLNLKMTKQKTLNEFLLNVVRSIFQDMVSMDSVIKKVMKFAQRLVDADRSSLFLVDNKTRELYARIFDLDSEDQGLMDANEPAAPNTTKEIRFAVGTGIAGQVASTGKPLSIIDAYNDARFNSAVDKLTGYRTKSILCMPIFIRAAVIGVVQLVNKKSEDRFSKEDEDSFEVFAVYCGLALHHVKLYDKIRRSEQKSKVAVEVLSYHNTCSDAEFDKMRMAELPQNVPEIDDFYFAPGSVDELNKIHYSVYMFVDLFGLQRFDLDSLYRFAITVKKNYRRVPYHNWSHGWTVANSMYCILKSSNVFRPIERLALYVASICHDLDHRGRSNKYLQDTESPLAAIYTTSTMEHHHFNQTVTILQQEGHNIFSQLSSDEYKQVLGTIKHCILATDLSLFFPYKARVQDLIVKETFSWGVTDHRMLAQAMAMTAADLCASAKSWEVQVLTSQVIFEEFYDQGDQEKSAGRAPMAMMDREKAKQQPDCQVGFMSGICIPCYDTLYKLIPDTQPLLEGCQNNLKRWKEMAEEQKVKKEKEELVSKSSNDTEQQQTENNKETDKTD